MLNYIWPIVLMVVSEVIYQICAKAEPEAVNPFASLSVTYVVAAASSLLLYFALNRNASLLREYSRLNWAPFVFGVVIVGLEAGFIYAYKAGWQVSTVFIVQSGFISVALILVGCLLYKEPLTWNKLAGAVVCLEGLFLINLK